MSSNGIVTQVVGPVVDVRFPEGKVPAILNALEIHGPSGTVIAETLQHIGDDRVRCVAKRRDCNMVSAFLDASSMAVIRALCSDA